MQPKIIKSRRLRTDSPTELKRVLTWTHNDWPQCFLFAARFAAASLDSLVNSFNSQVGNCGFNSARAAHDLALITEFERRGIDMSCISNGQAISFAHKVALDPSGLRWSLSNDTTPLSITCTLCGSSQPYWAKVSGTSRCWSLSLSILRTT